MEYFVRNCVLHRSMQNKHSYPEHEMKYFFKALAKEPKKVVAMSTHLFFQVPTLEFGHGAGARVQGRARVQIRHR